MRLAVLVLVALIGLLAVDSVQGFALNQLAVPNWGFLLPVNLPNTITFINKAKAIYNYTDGRGSISLEFPGNFSYLKGTPSCANCRSIFLRSTGGVIKWYISSSGNLNQLKASCTSVFNFTLCGSMSSAMSCAPWSSNGPSTMTSKCSATYNGTRITSASTVHISTDKKSISQVTTVTWFNGKRFGTVRLTLGASAGSPPPSKMFQAPKCLAESDNHSYDE